jgi:cytochrome P450
VATRAFPPTTADAATAGYGFMETVAHSATNAFNGTAWTSYNSWFAFAIAAAVLFVSAAWMVFKRVSDDDSPGSSSALPGPRYFQSLVPTLSALQRGQLHRYHVRLMREYGENVRLRFPLPWDQLVFLTDPAAIQEVIVGANPPKAPEVAIGFDWMTEGVGGLLTAEWDEWLVQRRLVSPAMSETLVGSWQAIFEEQSVPLMARLEAAAADDSMVEMDALMVDVFLGIISRVTLGRRLDDDVVRELLTSIGEMLGEAVRRAVLPTVVADTLWAATATGRRCRDARTRVMATLNESVRRRREARAVAAAAGVRINGDDGGGGGGTTDAADLLDLLLDAEAEGVISAAQVSAQLFTFIFAGHDTTAHTLSFLLHEVCAAPHLQDALAAEAAAALPGRLDFPTRETLRSAPLLGRTFKEALRKHPVVAAGTLRALSAAVRLPSGERLPAGARVVVPNFALHRNPRHWPDPERFDPGRFTPEASEGRHPDAFQAFSSGPRSCIGQGLATAEALSVLAAIFRRFELRLVDGPKGKSYPDGAAIPEPADHYIITRKPANGVWFKVTARK